MLRRVAIVVLCLSSACSSDDDAGSKQPGSGGSSADGGGSGSSTGGTGTGGIDSGADAGSEAATGGSAGAAGSSCTLPPGSTSGSRVHVVYLVPSDKQTDALYVATLDKTIRDLQLWYRDHMDDATTFQVNDPVVQVVPTAHASSWYATNPTGGAANLVFWDNVLTDGFAATGGKFDDPQGIWLYYVDADSQCGQLAGSGTSGVAVLPANDLRGLTGKQNVPPCPADPPDNQPRCRWVGGLGHELGHAFGLPHPPGCDAGDPSCDNQALMWLGYTSYPTTFLRPDEQQILAGNGFFSTHTLPACTLDCTTP
jgi:hypothetical protein